MIFTLNEVDRFFADFLVREAGVASSWLWRFAALTSNAVGAGHVCLYLTEIAGEVIVIDEEEVAVPLLPEVRALLIDLAVVGEPGELSPLTLEGDRLYLYRYYRYERELADSLLRRAAPLAVDEAAVAKGIARLFPRQPDAGPDWQRVAAVAAVRQQFSVISGGPGTGKTTTVVKVLALLLEQSAGSDFRIALAAPTGKAAARLKDSIRGAKEKLACSESTRQLIPEEVSTLHRLLGPTRSSARFRHGPGNLLPFDLVVVDEASMVALPLMAKLVAALHPEARLLLLGDRDQLASVEAGAVLGDICGGEYFTTGFREFLERVAGERLPAPEGAGIPPLSDSLVVLKKNYRFGAGSIIAKAGMEVNAGRGEEARRLLEMPGDGGGSWRRIPPPAEVKEALAASVIAGFSRYLSAENPADALASFDLFRILCAVRQGTYGVEGVNRMVEEILVSKRLIDLQSRWYRGRPIMITVNDYNVKLFNGDVGIIFPDEGGSIRAFFPAADGGLRSFAPVRLPPHETVYAMTVHKSQGSEFDRLLLLLPPHDTGILTRELIYTGITRARTGVEIWSDGDVFSSAVTRKTVRNSGLHQALWQNRG